MLRKKASSACYTFAGLICYNSRLLNAYGEPFEDASDDVYENIADAIKEWCSKMNIEQGERTDEEMMDFINEYDYEDDETYFYIRTFTFE